MAAKIMRFTLDGQPQDSKLIKTFHETDSLAATFCFVLFEPKDFSIQPASGIEEHL
jgi:hypothetical protein